MLRTHVVKPDISEWKIHGNKVNKERLFRVSPWHAQTNTIGSRHHPGATSRRGLFRCGTGISKSPATAFDRPCGTSTPERSDGQRGMCWEDGLVYESSVVDGHIDHKSYVVIVMEVITIEISILDCKAINPILDCKRII